MIFCNLSLRKVPNFWTFHFRNIMYWYQCLSIQTFLSCIDGQHAKNGWRCVLAKEPLPCSSFAIIFFSSGGALRMHNNYSKLNFREISAIKMLALLELVSSYMREIFLHKLGNKVLPMTTTIMEYSITYFEIGRNDENKILKLIAESIFIKNYTIIDYAKSFYSSWF